ncbi:MAG: HAMP domain-containing histidine kinase [Spirochaetaceae bacterium]|nr:HAMP domain-containing histidine kinase [Spirochaetaceae bacterium]
MLGIESESAICQPTRAQDPGPELAALRRIVLESRLGLIFDEYPLLTTLLDSSRRIVYANRRSLELMDAAGEESVLGLRFGEAFGCVHARESAAGCGTSAACRFCGAARSVDEGLAGSSVSEECSISRDREGRGESLDMRIWARPIDLEGGAFVLLAAEDISAEKRREVLERVFYHDIANTASGIRSILDLIRMLPGEDPAEYLDLIRAAAGQLIDEIESQRALKAAESRELAVRPVLLDGGQALVAATGLFAYRLHGKATRVAIAPGSEHPLVETDPALLHRVLVNMLKNALEAAERDETVVAGARVESGGEDGTNCAVFWVRNRAVMPEATQSRLFHRSFSTKGPGRGVGTYGMRLLGEGYLGGTIRFRSEPGEGTTFELRLPSGSPLL